METILIIDDEPASVRLLCDMLDDGSYRFECASSFEEACAVVEERGEEIRAVLLDWALSDARGLELLEWLQARPALANVEVVVQSGDFEPENIERGIDHGAYYYLTKPFDKAQLRAIVRAAISSFELKRDLARKIEETQSTFGLLAEGVFRFRSLAEARLLSIHLGSAAGDPQMAVALHELLINAVEHGNLEISYQEKTELLASGGLKKEIARRLDFPEYRERRVEVRVTRLSDRLDIVIEDGGPGFDFERYLTIDAGRLFDSHGRGIVLAGAALEIRYLEPGNKVEVLLPLAAA